MKARGYRRIEEDLRPHLRISRIRGRMVGAGPTAQAARRTGQDFRKWMRHHRLVPMKPRALNRRYFLLTMAVMPVTRARAQSTSVRGIKALIFDTFGTVVD